MEAILTCKRLRPLAHTRQQSCIVDGKATNRLQQLSLNKQPDLIFEIDCCAWPLDLRLAALT